MRYDVVVTTPQLWESSHSDYQIELASTVLDLRNRCRLQYTEIADYLTAKGMRSAQGKLLLGKHVHSIYKKWTARADRNARQVSVVLRDVWIEV